MAAIKTNQEQTTNPYLLEIEDNLSRFLENISCLKETYEDTERTLLKQKTSAEKKYNDLINSFPKEESTGEMEIPVRHYREYQKKDRHRKRTERALILVPQSFLVSLVSIYDQFFAGIVRLIYRIEPDKLKESNKSFSYRDLCAYSSVQEVKVEIVDETVEDLLRDSHVKQFAWLEKAMGLNTLREFKEWPAFVELTERRNLFVHSDGIVSQQYINICRNENVPLPKEITKGSQLSVDKDYFEKAFMTLYIVGIKITQMLCHTIYNRQYPNDYSAIDKILINNVYELISEELYDVAISVSEFANDDKIIGKKHNGHDKCFILLNYAQSYKWSGQDDKCKELLAGIDCSTWKDELLIPKLTLEEEYDQVYAKMRSVGKGSDILTPESYRQWPIFKEIRKEKPFASVFKEIFGEELEINMPQKVESIVSFFDSDELIELTNQLSTGSNNHFFFYYDLKDKLDGKEDEENGNDNDNDNDNDNESDITT